jgi:hypothetical protein
MLVQLKQELPIKELYTSHSVFSKVFGWLRYLYLQSKNYFIGLLVLKNSKKVIWCTYNELHGLENSGLSSLDIIMPQFFVHPPP